jgi:hypothetical protein
MPPRNLQRWSVKMRTYGAVGLLMLLVSACGDGSTTSVEPPIEDPPDPPTPPPEVEGDALYAADDENNLFLIGTEDPGTVVRTWKISGLPFLRHIVGIDFRPSTGELYGVGNDGRVYVIDTETGAATPVSSEPFTSEIGLFDHFGMTFEADPERIRLIAGWGGNWSIDPDDGTAVREADVRYAEGDANEGKTLEVSGLSYIPPGALDSLLAVDSRRVAGSQSSAIQALVYDSFNGTLAGAVDPATGEFQTLGPVEGIRSTHCAAVTFDPSGFVLALAPVAAAVAPELAGAYGLFRMSTGGLAAFAGAVGAPMAQTSLQTIAFFQAVAGAGGG